MPIPARERERRQVVSELIPVIAELLYRADKGNRYARFSSLSESARAVYVAEALMITAVEQRHERVVRVNQADSHAFALAEKDQRDVEWQARQDVIKFGPGGEVVRRGNFGLVPAGFCYLCTRRIPSGEAAVLELSATLKADVHAGCCLNNSRFEMTAQFAFRVKGGAR